MGRRDDVNALYKPSKVLDSIEKILFILDIVAALISLSSNQTINSISITFQIVVAFLYFLCNTVDDGYFWYKAEKERRKNGIQNGLGSRLSEYETEEYYNNNLLPSYEKYGMNILESNFFSKEIAGQMILKSAVCATISVVTLIIACRFLVDANVLLVIAQTAFSSYILVDFVMLLIYKIRMQALFDDAYNILILGNSIINHNAWLMSYIVEYEAIKAHYKVRLDEKVFVNSNSELSQKWATIANHRVDNGHD